MVEIILFASIAAFFALRLYMMLGKRTGHEPRPATAPREAEQADESRAKLRPAFTGPAAAGMEAIRAADGVFDPQAFLGGARGAYEMIVNAYADGDRDALSNLLAPKVLERYVAAIDAREAAGHKQISDLVKLESAKIEEAGVADGVAHVTVRYVAELATGVTDAEGAVVDGDPSQIHRAEELWTFERRTDAADPNWVLAKVRQG